VVLVVVVVVVVAHGADCTARVRPRSPLTSATVPELRRVCVFCGSRPGEGTSYVEAARSMGAELAARGIELVYGGGAVGLMGIVADAVLDAGGSVTGVIPTGLFSREVAHDRVTRLHHTATMHERKALMYELADAFVAMPGGLGTLDELFETLTWAQLGLHEKPVGLLDVDGFFGDLLGFLRRTETDGFVKHRHLARLRVAGGPAALLDELADEPPAAAPWIGPEKL